MPTTLNAFAEDKRINEIKAAAAAKDDSIPFLLLPVRIETRFMELDEPSEISATDSIDAVLDHLLLIQVEVLDLKTAQEAGAVVTQSLARLQQVYAILEQVTNLTAKNKRIIKEMADSLLETVTLVSVRLGGTVMNALKAEAQNLVKTINDLPVDPYGLLSAARQFVLKAKAVRQAMELLATRNKTPYQNVKNKKDLYEFVKAKLQAVTGFYQTGAEEVKSIKYITANQLASITEHHNAARSFLGGVHTNLQAVHTDPAWTSFLTETVRPAMLQIRQGMGQFDATVLPALRALPAPPQADFHDLLLQSMKALITLKRFSPEAGEKYETVARFKEKVKGSINFIDQSHKLVSAAEKDRLQKLQKVYDALGASLPAAETKLGSYGAKNKSQVHGISSLSKYLHTDAVAILEKAKEVIAPQVQKVHELWVRIYPDDIFVHTHEEALTAKEVESGKRFWNAWWAASDDRDGEKAAWKRLCTTHGTRRASWIASVLDPRKTDSPENAQKLGEKPFSGLTLLQTVAKNLAQSLQSLKPTLAPAAFWNAVSLGQITAAVTHLQQLHNGLQNMSAVPDFMMQKMEVQLVRAQGDIQAIVSKISALTPQETAAFQPKITAFGGVVDGFNAVAARIEQLDRKTMDQILATTGAVFTYAEPPLKEDAWTAAPHTYTLPERFAVITLKGNEFQHVVVGRRIPDNLQVGPNPELFSNKKEDGSEVYAIDANGDLVIEEGLKWMTDYKRAVEMGMGVTLPLTEAQYNGTFDKLLVVGIKQGDADNSKALLEKLLLNHVYAPDGMSILKVGTPTNNSETEASGYSTRDNDKDERFNIEVLNQLFCETETHPGKMTDGQRLAHGLGLAASVLQKVNNKGFTQVSNAFTMNRALWHATLGHTMEEMWDHVFTYDNIRRTESFFTAYCPARGILPSIRIGVQPYGILPTTAYSRFKLYNDYDLDHLPPILSSDLGDSIPQRIQRNQKQQVRFEVRLHEILKTLNNIWTGLRSRVAHYGQLESGNPQQKFIEMLGLNAGSVDYFYRYGINLTRKGVYAGTGAQEYDIRATHGSEYMRTLFKDLMVKGRFVPSFDFPDETHPELYGLFFRQEDARYSRIRDQFEQSRLFRNRFIAGEQELRQLTGFLIDSQPLSPDNTLEKNASGATYIDWLLETFMDGILAGNNPENFPSRSLLFLLLRQSLMQAYQEGALEILQAEGLIEESLRKKVGNEDTYSEWAVMGSQRKYNTKWHLLLKDIDELKSRLLDRFTPANPFYSYLLSATNDPSTNQGRSSLAVYINKPDTNPIFNGYPNHVQHRNFLTKVDAVREAIGRLKTIPTAELALLLSEHLDLCSYRLDAWLTGLVNKRLFDDRAGKPSAIHLGAYGWVENLKRDVKQPASPDELPDGLKPNGSPVYKDGDNDGFIHAPSINHAIAAAVLRGAYRANYAEEDINNRLAVNLSSSRVRMGLKLIDGVQNGLSIGAILGFQFEKGLHERYKLAELDKFILPLRNAFPLVVPVKENAQNGKAPTYNSNVVDGMALLNKIYDTVTWMDFPAQKTMLEILMDPAFATQLKWLSDLVTTNGGAAKEYEQIAREIDRMADAVDALGDLAISESVYQIIQGNHVRAAAVVSSLAKGKNIPEPQIVDTPRTGTIVTQRVILNLEPVTAFTAPAGWGEEASPRAQAELSLNKWLGEVIGNPAHIRCIVEYGEPEAALQNAEFPLGQLNLQPIDFLFLSANETEVKQRIAYLFRQSHLDLSKEAQVRIDLKMRIEEWPENVRSFYELDHLLKQVRNLLLQTRAAGADHFVSASSPLDDSNPGNHDVEQYKSRVEAALARLKSAADALLADTFIKDLLDAKVLLEAPQDSFTEAQFTAIRTFMLTAHQYGLVNAVPNLLFEVYEEKPEAAREYFRQLSALYKQVKERIQQATDLQKKIDAKATDKQRLSVYNDLFKILFGKAFLSLPLYTSASQPQVAAQLQLDETAGLLRQAGPMAMQEWLQSIARVRPKMNALEMLDTDLSAAQEEGITLAPVQFNYKEGDYWLGVQFPATYEPGEDKLSLVLVNPAQWQSETAVAQAGLVLDEWMEVIPNKAETTGIAINYDQPNAMPPQSLLLAVSPVKKGSWDWEDLVFTLLDTLEMAKNRAVEPDHLEQSVLSHVLPSILSEVAPPQLGDVGDANPLGVQVVMDFAFNEQPEEE